MRGSVLRATAIALAAAWLVPAAGPARAVAVSSWSASTGPEFSRGTLDGTALDEEGRIQLALALEGWWGPAAGVVWAVRSDGTGRAFLALSSPGRVLRVGPDGATELWYQAEAERLVAALAPDGRGGVYFGVSPGGQILHAARAGAAELVAETGAAFVWSLSFANRALWVGTGSPGHLLRWTRDGGLETVFEAEDDPVRCVLALASGGAVAGTGSQGRVVRFDPQDRPFVILDADEPEIVDLALGADGSILALASTASKPARGAPGEERVDESVRVTVTAPPPGEEDEQGEPAAAVAESAPRRPQPARRPSAPLGAVLYRIATDGGAQTIWRSADQTPFALTRAGDGKLLVATGDLGRVVRLDERGRTSMLLEIPSDQASALAAADDGSVLIGGTSDARLERLGPELLAEGSYLTPPVDAQTVAEWGRVSWEADLPAGAGLRVFARSGNTDEPDATWSDWSAIEPAEAGGDPGRPPAARWLQLRVELRATGDGRSPLLRRLEVFYLPRNRPPRIAEFEVQPAGVVWTQAQSQPQRPQGPVVVDDPVSRRIIRTLGARGAVAVRKAFELGARTAVWKAEDPDGDELRYALEIRREGAEAWIPLALDVEEDHVGWDARSFSDGWYRLRLTADDSPGNPAGKGFQDRQLSPAFHIDNTRPVVAAPRIRSRSGAFDVEFVATDAGGNVAAVEVAVDGGDWQPLDPLDGVADSDEEFYRLRVEPAAARTANRSLRVRVTDASGNLGGDAWPLGPQP